MRATFFAILALVFLLGSFGGFVNWLFFKVPPRCGSPYGLWYYTWRCNTRFPGLVTNVFLGGLGAVAFWCLHGPYSGAVLIGTDVGRASVNLTIGEIPISFLIGMAGPKYLLTEARLRCSSSPTNNSDDKNVRE